MYDRLSLLLTKEQLDKLKNKTILIAGIGGVGGIAFELLVRSAIYNIIIIDYDKFEISNLNRQILCTNIDINKYKVDIAKTRALSINKDVNITAINEKIDDVFFSNFNYKIDYIIDAVDDISAKLSLIKYAINNNIKIISSCGTGNKFDASKLYITNIWKTENDPLAKKLRNILRKNNINYKLPVVCSKEMPIKTNDKVASNAFVPNAAGILLANYVFNDILESN